MPEIMTGETTEENAGIMEQAGPLDLAPIRPTRRAVGGDEFGL
jgi:hypothetical protein